MRSSRLQRVASWGMSMHPLGHIVNPHGARYSAPSQTPLWGAPCPSGKPSVERQAFQVSGMARGATLRDPITESDDGADEALGCVGG